MQFQPPGTWQLVCSAVGTGKGSPWAVDNLCGKARENGSH